MAKNKGKKLKEEGKCIAKPNIKTKKMKLKVNQKRALNPGPGDADPSGATTCDPDMSKYGGSSKDVEKEIGIKKRLSGFIFMCNASTKLECFRYRVFGLPMGQSAVVEEIKPGAKLFLFDFEKKLLYGIYEATSAGQVNLEPAAFGGKYPAQVKFKIFKQCLPMHETSLKHVIKENFEGWKFKQELGRQHVKKLLSSFQPLPPLLSPLVSQVPQNVSLAWAIPPPARENQFPHIMRLPPSEIPYLTEARYMHPAPLRPPPVQSAHEMRYGHAALVEPSPVQSGHVLQKGYHRPASDVALVHTTLAHQSLPATVGHYMPISQRPYFNEGIAHKVQEPYPRTIEERAPHEQVTNLGMQYQFPFQGQSLYKDNAAGYNSYRHAMSTRYTSNMQVAPAPAPAPYTPPVVQVQLPAPGRPQGCSTYYSYAGATG